MHQQRCYLFSVPPKIDGSSEVSKPEVVVNNTITLHCPASGIPIPKITWYKDDTQIRRNTSHLHLVDNGWKLRVRHARVADTGRYSCRAKNIAGETEKYYDLNVLGESRSMCFYMFRMQLFLHNPTKKAH